MGTLGQLGVNGLIAVNSWMSTISANMNGASRTAYKPTRVSLLDSTVNTWANFQVPSATLRVQATTLEWAQGSVRNSDSSAHFALQGQGFFVLVDDLGQYYLTRDGEFHWDGLGYLRNSNGLRVLSNGQDFVRKGNQDLSDLFDPDGESQQLARYGDKSLLVVDVANRDGLRFSKYGATVFEVDGDLPLRVENNFDTSTDGLTFIYNDPKQLPYVGDRETPRFEPFNPLVPGSSNFQIRLGNNGLFDFSTVFGTEFDPAVHTIRDVENAINAYGTTNNVPITANYDPVRDRLTLRNLAEPKVADPNFRVGNFAIDFGDNGFFTFQGFDPRYTTIDQIVQEINRYAIVNGVNITASFNTVTRQLVLNNTTGAIGDNSIRFDGINGSAIADFFNMAPFSASTGGGAQNVSSSSNIDNNPPSANTFAQITPQDAATMPLERMIRPDTSIGFTGPNGAALAQFFQLNNAVSLPDSQGTFVGSRLQSSQDIDNSRILDSTVLGEHSLDITAAMVPTRTFNQYLNLTDNSTPILDPSGVTATYTHDKLNNIVIADGDRGFLGISQAQATGQFDLVMDLQTNASFLELHFGQDRPGQIDSGGFTLQYHPGSGDVYLFQRGRDPNDVPVLLNSLFGALPVISGLGGTPHRFSVRLEKSGELSFSVDGVSQSFTLLGDISDRIGYLTLGHFQNRLELFNMYADFKSQYNHYATGAMVSTSVKAYARKEVNDAIYNPGSARIVQSALESSTASLTEYLPMLGMAQKVFGSISKIISVSNAMQDDMNSLIR